MRSCEEKFKTAFKFRGSVVRIASRLKRYLIKRSENSSRISLVREMEIRAPF
jgi:hypothetical protein